MEESKLENSSISNEEGEGEQAESEVNLECLPLEIFEKILQYDDGELSLVLRETSPTLLDKVNGCLSSKLAGWRHWRKICYIQIERDMLNKILASFDSLTARERELELAQNKLKSDPIPLVDHRYLFNWEDVFNIYHNLCINLEAGDAHIVRMKEIETLIRDEILLCYSNNRKQRISYTYPLRMARPFGTFFFNLNLPPRNRIHTDTMTVFEDMHDVKYTTDIGCRQNDNTNVLLKLKVMMVNNFKKPSDNPCAPLPSVGRILIFSCVDCVNLVPLQMGKSFKIPLERDPNMDEFENEAGPIIAFNENDLIIWSNKDEIFHYTVSQSEHNDVTACKLESWKFQGLEESWELFRDAQPNTYHPILKRIKREKSEIDKLYNYADDNNDNEDQLILEFISPCKAKQVFDPSHHDAKSQDQLPKIQLVPIQRMRLFDTRDWIEREFSPIIGITSEHGCSVFWSKFAFAMTWNNRKWIHTRFNEILPKLHQISTTISKLPVWRTTNPLPLVELISQNIFMIGYRHSIIIYETKFILKTEHRRNDYGDIVSSQEILDIEFEFLRQFKLPLAGRIEIITHLSCDFEAGHLYLFAITQVPKYRMGELFKYFKITINPLSKVHYGFFNIFNYYKEKGLFKKLLLKYM